MQSCGNSQEIVQNQYFCVLHRFLRFKESYYRSEICDWGYSNFSLYQIWRREETRSGGYSLVSNKTKNGELSQNAQKKHAPNCCSSDLKMVTTYFRREKGTSLFFCSISLNSAKEEHNVPGAIWKMPL